MTKLAYTILFVENLQRAKVFYEKYFDQVADVDMGELIGFESGLALWGKQDIAEQSGLRADGPLLGGRGGMELEFHTEDIEDLFRRLHDAGVEMVHGVKTHPWGQKVFRCLDPDGHCIEVDEDLKVTARRLASEGRSTADIASIFGIVQEKVAEMLES